MAEITEYVDLTITVSDAAPGAPNFGSLLMVGNSESADAGLAVINLTPTGIKAYVDTLSGETDDILYKLLATAVSQTPHTDKADVFVIKSALTDSQVITPIGPFTEGKEYALLVNGTEISHVCSAAADAEEVATALHALADVLAGVGSVDGTGFFTLSGATADDNVFVDGVDSSLFTIEVSDASAVSIATSLDAAVAAGSEAYGVLIDVGDDTSLAAAAAWAEANRKMLFLRTKDKDVLTGGGVLSTLFDAGYHRTALFFSTDDDNRLDAASIARFLATDPGSSDVQFKNHPGVTFDKLTASQFSAIKAKNGITYTSTAGVRFTDNGTAVSGRPLSVTRNIDWLDANIKVAVLSELVNSEIILISSEGITQIEKAIKGVLIDAEKRGVILPGWEVVSPKLSDISSTDANNGLMAGFRFSAVTGKATRKVAINGTLI